MKSDGDLKIPAVWSTFTLPDVFVAQGGKTPAKNNPDFWVDGGIPWVSPKDMKVDVLDGSQDKVSDSALTAGGLRLFPANSVLMVVRSGILRHTLPIAIATVPVTVNQDMKVFEPSKFVLPAFLAHMLRAFGRVILDQCAKSGTTVNSVELPALNKLKFPLPPLAEQKQIANKLDELLAQVDSIKTRLDAIPAILKRFRQSVLTAAVSGRLTGVGEPSLQLIATVAEVIGGLTKNKARATMPLTRHYLRVANVYENDLRLDDVAEIGLSIKELEKSLLRKGDLLVVEGNGSLDQIGRVALWQDEIPNCVHQNHLIKIRCHKEKMVPEFLLFFLMSPQGKSEIVSKATSGAGLYTLSISKVSTIVAPVFSIDHQKAIVERVSSLLAFSDQTEQCITEAITRINQLTQSILAKAFRGELTADWREQHPELISGEHSAQALLDRIRAERENLASVRRNRKKKAASQ